MIQLHHDCLYLDDGGGELVPVNADSLAVEVLGQHAESIDIDTVRQAAAAVVHFFREVIGRETVSVQEFAEALAKVLKEVGLCVVPTTTAPDAAPLLGVAEIDLRQLAARSGKGFELAFFKLLREEMALHLWQGPAMVRCRGLRSCVKQLLGARRWGSRCEELSDRIVDYLRKCLDHHPTACHSSCAVVVA